MNRYRLVIFAAATLSATLWAYACGDGTTDPPPPDPPRPTTVTVSPATTELTALGATVQLSAEVRDQNGQVMAGATVVWASDNAPVATVDGSGVVTAAGNGTATVTATAGGASGSATVTVAQEISAVVVTPATDTLVAGDTLRLAAEATDANGHAVAEAEFSWASSDTSVAVVDDAGLVSGLGPGQAEVTATAAGVTGRADLTVVAATPTTIAVTPDTVALTALGQTAQLGAEVRDQAGRAMEGVPVAWTSADTTVAAVDSAGLVTAAGAGETTIVATSGEASGEAVVTVMQSADSVVVSPAADTIAQGDTVPLSAEAFDQNGHAVEGAEFNWSSSNDAVATVDGSGLVRGVAEGTATITATAGDASGTSEITVENPDRAALVALYHATDGPNWVDSENWLSDSPLREWYGVDTDGSGRVVGIDLAGRWDNEAEEWILHGLTGPIPSELGDLARLESLRVTRNQLSGPIPSELGNLSNLKTLDLDRNNLSGPIPPEFGRLSSLVNLFIHFNNLSGPIPPELGRLPNLRQLRLGRNTFTGPIPSELGNLTNLRSLDLSHGITQPGGLSGPIPSELGKLTNLTWLSLSGNSLSGTIPPELGSLDQLTTLDLRFNGLTGSIPPEFGSLHSLQVLWLRANRLDGAIPSSFVSLPLARLWFDDNPGLCAPGTGTFLEWLQGIRDWQGPLCSAGDRAVLESQYNVANGSGWSDQTGWLDSDDLSTWHGISVDSLGLVTAIDLAGNGLAGSLVSGLAQLARLTELRVGDNPTLSGRLPGSLTELPPLRVLHYAGTDLCVPVEGGFSSWVSEIPSHRGTGVACAAISDREILAEFYQATGGPTWSRSDGWLSDAPLGTWYGVTTNDAGKVTGLNLARNDLTGPVPSVLGNLANLALLDLHGNGLTGEVPRALGGLAELSHVNLGGNQLSGTIPPELGNLVNLRTLNLNFNFDLSASIPPEFGKLVNLRNLALAGCFGTGSIPTELGDLASLEHLDLSGVRFSGSIPPEFGRLTNLRTLRMAGGNSSGPIPAELGGLSKLRVLDLADNNLSGTIPSELGELTSLRELFLDNNSLAGAIPVELGGLSSLERLSLDGNDLSGSIPPELGGLAGLAQLRMSDNDLTGPIPSALGSLSILEQLYLGGNDLSGAIPPELGGLARLRDLILTLNPSLSGPLPTSLSNLGSLESLQAGGTELCAPSNPGFLEWLNAISSRRVAVCSDAPVLAYLTQATQSREFPVPLVAGEDALLRVFATAARANSERIPRVRASFHLDGALAHVSDIPGKAGPIPTEVDESSLLASANTLIPKGIVQPGLEMVIEIDPDGTLDAGLGVGRRIPETGRLAVDVRNMPMFELTLVPFLWTEDPDSSILAPIAAMAADPENHELLQDTRTLLPVGRLMVHAHEPVMTSGPHFRRVDIQTEAIRVMEGGTGYYMGMMSPESLGYTGGGLAYLGGWSSFAAMESDIIAHELGHNMSLMHAPCGQPTGLDPAYPHPHATIGAWGYEFRDGGSLVSPNRYRDLMSYCNPPWVSDYNFDKALRFRLAREGGSAHPAIASPTRSLLLWGGADSAGAPFLEPAFVLDVPPSLPRRPTGGHEITGRDAGGTELFSLRFDMPETADGDGSSSFAFALPVRDAWADELASITLSGPGGSFTLDGESDLSMAILRNPRTGQIRGILRDPLQAMQAAGDGGAGRAADLEVLFSRGIPGPEAWRR